MLVTDLWSIREIEVMNIWFSKMCSFNGHSGDQSNSSYSNINPPWNSSRTGDERDRENRGMMKAFKEILIIREFMVFNGWNVGRELLK